MSARVVVAMSGGVDSAVAAALLVHAGYDVVGVMLRLWAEPAAPEDAAPPARQAANRCCAPDAMISARAVAECLGIPFYVVNAEEPFRDAVVASFIREYAAGRTPNPCLVCNRVVRFGYLLRHARAMGASYLATGHYARLRRGSDGRFELWRGVDRGKDQSYVLSVLGQDDLAQVLFPVGEYTKATVRELAAARGLPAAGRPESQDLCFVADGDYRGFLARWAPESLRPGPIVDSSGRRIGTHRGLPLYTVGQRSGLGLSAPRPLYVVELDAARNVLVVGPADELGRNWLRTGAVNWVSGEPPGAPFQAQVQIRYRAMPAPATVTPLPDGGVVVRFVDPVRDITPGQAAVFYHDEICLGGGTILEARRVPGEEGADVGADGLD